MAQCSKNRETPDQSASSREIAVLVCVLTILLIFAVSSAVSVATARVAIHTTSRPALASVAWGSDPPTVTRCRYVGPVTNRLSRLDRTMRHLGSINLESMRWLSRRPFGQRGETRPPCIGL